MSRPSSTGKIRNGLPSKGALKEGRTIVFCDQSGFYLLPTVVRTYAPMGQTPILREHLSRDHLSAMSGITLEGKLYMLEQDRSFKGDDWPDPVFCTRCYESVSTDSSSSGLPLASSTFLARSAVSRIVLGSGSPMRCVACLGCSVRGNPPPVPSLRIDRRRVPSSAAHPKSGL